MSITIKDTESAQWTTSSADIVARGRFVNVAPSGIGALTLGTAGASYTGQRWLSVGQNNTLYTRSYAAEASLRALFHFAWYSDVSVISGYQTISFHSPSGIECSLQFDNFLRVWRLYRGATLLATSTRSFTLTEFIRLQINLYLHDTLGRVTVKANGATVINFTGDTLNLGGSRLEMVSLGTDNSGGNKFRFSDWVYAIPTSDADFLLGDVRFWLKVPTGVGSSAQWTPSAGPNWETVDEIPQDGDTTYNASSTAGHKDLLAAASVSIAGSVHCVVPGLVAKATGVGLTEVRTRIKSGTTEAPGATVALGTVHSPIGNDVHTTDPATGVAWAAAAADAIELGYELVSAS